LSRGRAQRAQPHRAGRTPRTSQPTGRYRAGCRNSHGPSAACGRHSPTGPRSSTCPATQSSTIQRSRTSGATIVRSERPWSRLWPSVPASRCRGVLRASESSARASSGRSICGTARSTCRSPCGTAGSRTPCASTRRWPSRSTWPARTPAGSWPRARTCAARWSWTTRGSSAIRISRYTWTRSRSTRTSPRVRCIVTVRSASSAPE